MRGKVARVCVPPSLTSSVLNDEQIFVETFGRIKYVRMRKSEKNFFEAFLTRERNRCTAIRITDARIGISVVTTRSVRNVVSGRMHLNGASCMIERLTEARALMTVS